MGWEHLFHVRNAEEGGDRPAALPRSEMGGRKEDFSSLFFLFGSGHSNFKPDLLARLPRGEGKERKEEVMYVISFFAQDCPSPPPPDPPIENFLPPPPPPRPGHDDDRGLTGRPARSELSA